MKRLMHHKLSHFVARQNPWITSFYCASGIDVLGPERMQDVLLRMSVTDFLLEVFQMQVLYYNAVDTW